MNNHAVALRLAQAGISIFPANSETKRPLVRFTAAATKLKAGVDYFWSRYGDGALPCIHLYGAGLLVIDLDRGHEGDVDGVAAFEGIVDRYGELPPCPAVRTPRGGVHLYFRQPADREPVGNSASRIAPGIDVRGRNGFTVAPGAVMATGEFYEAIAGTPDLADAFAAGTIPEPPAWLIELAERPNCPTPPERGPSSSAIPKSRLRTWALAVLEGEAAKLASAPKGSRNELLNTAAFLVSIKGGAHGVLAEEEAWDALWAACVANGYIADDGAKAFRQTFESGWAGGLLKPHPGPRERLSNIDQQFAGLKPRVA